MSKEDRITIKGMSVSATKEGDGAFPRHVEVGPCLGLIASDGRLTFTIHSGPSNDITVVIKFEVCKIRTARKYKGSEQL